MGLCTYQSRWCDHCTSIEQRQLDRPAPHQPESWEELVTAAVHEVFPIGVADLIVQADAFGALVYRVRDRCQLVAATPWDVLREIDEGDQWFAGRADEPAVFLAAKVREL